MLDLKYVGMMLWILLLHLVTVCGLSGAADFERALCTSEACYTLHMNKVNFDRAHANCVDNGGYLMTVTDRQEERVLELLLPLVGRRREKSAPFWIGLKLRRGQCVLPERALKGFEWLSSTEDAQYSNWAAGQPQISTCTEERCAQIRYFSSGQNHLKWVDGQCKKTAFYACKFYFKGMCKPLALMGPGQINYTAPFSSKPLRNDMKSLPLGTYAEVSCGDDQEHFSMCRAVDDSYGWSSAGPLCASGKENCAFNNGGCEHLCLEAADGVLCACKDGYELSQDQASCSPKDYCRQAACQHQCIMGDSGFTCTCPVGFKLDANLQNCSDIDECQTLVCADHACVNVQGSYTCDCNEGYKMVDGKCQDVDECAESRCDQKCLNSLGSFSCHCDVGFVASEDGRLCVDVDECLSGRCEFRCTNTIGSFTCACPENSHVGNDGISCAWDWTDVGATSPPNERVEMLRTAEPSTIPTVQSQNPNQTFPTDVPVLHSVSTSIADPPNNVSFGRNVRVSKPFNSRMLICIIGSVIPLLLLVMVTVAIVIFRCSRSQREVKKTVTADGYCWVSSGFEPHLEKLYESVLTDDPPASPLESEA